MSGVSQKKVKCPKCGGEFQVYAYGRVTCPHCGLEFKPEPPEKKEE